MISIIITRFLDRYRNRCWDEFHFLWWIDFFIIVVNIFIGTYSNTQLISRSFTNYQSKIVCNNLELYRSHSTDKPCMLCSHILCCHSFNLPCTIYFVHNLLCALHIMSALFRLLLEWWECVQMQEASGANTTFTHIRRLSK